MEEVQQEGFFIIKNLISSDLITVHLKNIKSEISKSSQELGVSVSNYLNCTGRWGDSSQITKPISQLLNKIIQDNLEQSLSFQQCDLVLLGYRV